MSKAVLISIRPEWVRKILNRSKTVEIRKNTPFYVDAPFRCYIYCTKGGRGKLMVNARAEHPAITAGSANEREQAEAFGYEAANGKIVAEFTCDRFAKIDPSGEIPKWAMVDACLTREDVYKYLGGDYGFGWRISNLKIYDTPRELRELNGLQETRFGWEPVPITRPPQSWRYVEEETWSD